MSKKSEALTNGTNGSEIIVLLDDDFADITRLRSFNEQKIISKDDLPKPSFRLIGDYEYKKRNNTAAKCQRRKLDIAKDSYYHYEEPSPEDLMKTVEYDMDEYDEKWLKSFNEENKAKFNIEISENDFERIMDRLEKESYFESKRTGQELVSEIDEDAVCAICNDGECHNANQILFCDMCDLAVHQECYGVPYIPEGQWLCRRCLQSPSKSVSCVLCPNKGGAFKQTETNEWAHVICALWIPEVCFANAVFLEPIDNIDQIPPARWKLTCYICKQKKKGACIQCHKNNCYVPFHVTCAQQAGFYMRIRTCEYDGPDGPFRDVKKEAFCDAHAPKDKNRKKGMYTSDDEEQEDGDDDDATDVEDEIELRVYKRLKTNGKDSMTKTRKILAEKRASDPNPISKPAIKDDKLVEISKLLTLRGKRRSNQQSEELRLELIRKIEGYWLLKREERKGVPLLRRLQVSYNNSLGKLNSSGSFDEDLYTRLRYDLEKARLLVGEVKKRELLKKRLFKLSKEIIEKRYQIIDHENPATED